MTAKTPAVNIAIIIMAIIMVVYVLLIGKDLLLPLVVAILLFYILLMFTRWLNSLSFRGYKLPCSVCAAISVGVVSSVIVLLFSLAGNSIYGIVQQAPEYQEQINAWLAKTNQMLLRYDIDASMMFSSFSFASFMSGFANAVSGLAQYFALIMIYTLFLAMEYGSMQRKIKAMYPEERSYKKVSKALGNFAQGVSTYLRVKTLMSLLTGLISYAILAACGAPYAAFWGLIIFALNFIPTVGSILAILMVVPTIIIQLGFGITTIIAAMCLMATQITIGSIIEPRIMGRSLNLSPLVILLSLGFWGTIWGPIGALLCVPLMVVLNIALAQFPQTRKISIALSQDGKITE